MGLLGGVVHSMELRHGDVPRSLGWALFALAGWGVALMPKSGFWAFIVPAAVALRRPSAARAHEALAHMADHAVPTLEVFRRFPQGFEALLALDRVNSSGPLDPLLRSLVKLRASQINGCAYCIDLHRRDALARGETESRLALLPAWRGSAVFTVEERAALALAEAMTLTTDPHLPAAIEAARASFDAESYAALVFTIGTINTWNRVVIAAHATARHDSESSVRPR